jgi:structural protein KPP10_ORF10
MARTYDLRNVICTIGGTAVEGYGESDAIDFEWDDARATLTMTADGKAIYSRTNNRALTVTITLSQTSRTYLMLMGMLELQHGKGGAPAPPFIPPLPFFLLDPSNGETFSSFDCVFMTEPAPSKGKEVGEVEFELSLPDVRRTLPIANVI